MFKGYFLGKDRWKLIILFFYPDVNVVQFGESSGYIAAMLSFLLSPPLFRSHTYQGLPLQYYFVYDHLSTRYYIKPFFNNLGQLFAKLKTALKSCSNLYCPSQERLGSLFSNHYNLSTIGSKRPPSLQTSCVSSRADVLA